MNGGAVGWGVFSWLLPPFARNQIGLSTSLIGLLLLANALTVVVAQVPVARFAEGRRRALTMALAGGLFCGACLLVEVADASRAIVYAVLIAAVIAAGVGECLHTTALTPTAAFGVAAGVALAAAVSMLRLERRLPEAARLTPRPRR